MRAALALVLFLAACAPTYGKPGLTQAEFDRDAYECQRDALMLPRTPQSVMRGASGVPVYADPTLGWGDAALSARVLDACMRARGYRRE